MVVLECILLLFTLSMIGIQLYYMFSKTAKKVNEFPGPKVLPVIGNLFDIWLDEEQLFNKLRELSNKYYCGYKLWSSTFFYAIFLVRPEDMQIVLSNVKHNEKSDIYMLFDEWLGEGLLTSNGDKWQVRRKILTPTFHFAILKQFIGTFNKHSVQLAVDIKEKINKVIDILPLIHKCSLHTITEAAMGTKLSDVKSTQVYRNAIHRMGDIMVFRMMRPWLYFRVTNLFTKAFYEERFLLWYLKQFTKNVIDEREKNLNNDVNSNEIPDVDDLGQKNRLAFLDLLLSAKKRDEIDYEGVREEVDTFMFEGHDTIAMAMQFCFMLLACNHEIQDKAYREVLEILGDSKREPTFEDLQNMNYLEMVIKESLRLYPSVPLISRVAGEDIHTDMGRTIPKGSILILNIYDTHHSPEVYPDPEKFDPERFLPEKMKNRHPYAYLPFSAGSRNCIGQKYALLNMKSMIALTLLKCELLPVDTPETITLITDIILRTKKPIKVQVKPRNTSY